MKDRQKIFKQPWYSAMRITMLLLFSMMAAVAGYAQQSVAVSGRITDSQGEPLPGVTIMVKGTTTGTITDVDGNYTLGEVPGDAVLAFSFIGMETQEIPVDGASRIDVTLHESVIGLDEVVAIGYGTATRRDLTGAVSSVKSSDITAAPTGNAMEAIQGRVAGLDIVKPSGEAGEDVEILLRGSRSIYGDNSPLFIIDGIPGSYSEVNPSDIESIDVLKDASSTAIYGSAGSNGVIIITTRRGRAGKATVNMDAYYGISGSPKFLYGMTGNEWTRYYREVYKYVNGGYPSDMSAILTDNTMLSDYNEGKWIDWVDEIAGDKVSTQNYSLSVTGGKDKSRVYASLTYNKEEGLLRNDGFEKYAMRLNIDQDLGRLGKIGFISNLTFRDRDRGVRNTFTRALSAFPLGDAYDDNGNIVHEYATAQYTPLGDFIKDQYVDNTKSIYINPTAFWEVTPLEGLSIKTIVNATLRSSRQGRYLGAQCNANRPSYAGTPYAEITNSQSYGYRWENIASYSVDIGTSHKAGATFVTSWSRDQDENSLTSGSGQELDAWSFYRLNSASSQYITSDFIRTQTMSYALRLNYSFKDRYLLTFSNRWDGVSWLSEGHKWDSFAAGALAWRISDEAFMGGTKNWLYNLKLRVGYGVTGNSGGLGAYGTQTNVYNYSSSGITIDGQIVPFTQYTGTYGNPGLGWEKSYNLNIGIDFGLLDNRIDGSIEWFDTRTKDLLFKRTMPITSGATGWGAPLSSWENIASTCNHGTELTLNTHNIRQAHFSWDTSFSFTHSREKIKSLPEGDIIAENLFEGEPIRSFYDYKYAGIWGTGASQATLDAYGVKPGWVKISTVEQFDEQGNGDGGVHKYSDDDRQILGHNNPDVVLGLNNSLTYKNLDFTIFVMGRFGQTIQSDLIGWYSAKQSVTINQPSGIDYWTEDNQSAFYPVPGSGDEQSVMPALTYRDGSFVKVKNITLGYSLPKRMAGRLLMEKCRLYATAYNPFIWVKDDQLKDTDPETNGSDSFPLYGQFVFGVKITF